MTSLGRADEDAHRAPSVWRAGSRRSGAAPADPAPLIVGFDGSMPATAALAWAAGTGMPIIVVRVRDPRPQPPGAHRPDPEPDVNDAQRVLGDHSSIAARRLADCAWRAELVEACSPAAGLAAAARRHGASGIVVGARGDGRGRAVLAGPLYRLLTETEIPVVVVPMQAAAHLLGSLAPVENEASPSSRARVRSPA